MDATSLIIVLSGVALAPTMLLVFAAGWIAATRRGGNAERLGDGPRSIVNADGVTAARINLADVRERLRRLEAIASGIDL